MKKIIECVPNFSEGRDKNIIDAITAEIEKGERSNSLMLIPERLRTGRLSHLLENLTLSWKRL